MEPIHTPLGLLFKQDVEAPGPLVGIYFVPFSIVNMVVNTELQSVENYDFCQPLSWKMLVIYR